ncbi:MAG TPA: holdfast anchoring protein HfaA [Rhizomicrobium sp.]|nr:holdfast anchoring protein HfaA [Rhizomicrobium sp.]
MNARIALLAIALAGAATAAQAGDYSNSASYNQGYGMAAGEENAPVNPSLRDANGNLTVVNGQFTSSQMSQQSGVQQMSTIASMSSQGTFTNSVSAGGGTSTATATAIGNQLNVVTVGNNNTVVVDSSQINNGNQTATTGH